VEVVVARIKFGLVGAAGASVGASVAGASVAAGGSVTTGAAVGVAAGAQAPSANANTIDRLNNRDKRDFILFS